MPLTLLLADLPRLLEDILRSVLEGDDVVVIRESRTDGDLARAAQAAGADVVVVTRDDPGDPAGIDPRLARLDGLAILAVGPTGKAAWLHRLRWERVQVGQVSAKTLFAAVNPALR